MSKEIKYVEEMPAPIITICPVVTTQMKTFQEAGESFLSLEQMFRNFSHTYGPNKYMLQIINFKTNYEMSIYREITMTELGNKTLFSRIVIPLPRQGQYPLTMCAQYHPPVSHVPISIDYEVKYT